MRVHVAGSMNMDVVATTSRHPQPGETIHGSRLDFFPGGKGANQAVAAARAGATTRMIARLGKDAFGPPLRTFLFDTGIDLSSVVDLDASTGTALIVVDEFGENTIVVVPGANAELSPTDVRSIEFGRGDILVSQYEVPLDTIEAFFAAGKAAGAVTILNPAPALATPASLLAKVDVLVVNENELGYFAGVDINPNAEANELIELARKIRTATDQAIVMTLGARGALALIGDQTVRVQGWRVSALDTTGAGDCFVGNIAARLASSETIEGSLAYANAAAAICVQRRGGGPSMPTPSEVQEMMSTR